MKTLAEKQELSKWFADTANWFVLFVRTYEERRVAELLQDKLDPERYIAFVPTKDYAFSKGGMKTVRRVPWLDGYVFIASTANPEKCLEEVKPIVYSDSRIYKLLSNDGLRENIALSEHDKAIMTTILDENFNIPAIEAVMVGDKVTVVDGTLKGIGGKVVRINKRKQTASLEIEMFGRLTACEIMIDIVNNSDTLQPPRSRIRTTASEF